MENFSKRTTASLFAAFILLMLGCGVGIAMLGEPATPSVHCDRHLNFTALGKV
jgi:hypothetical protein